MQAVILPDLTFNERNYEVFHDLNDRPDSLRESYVLYLNLTNTVITPEFPILNISEVSNFWGGTVIATCPNSAALLSNTALNARKAYYLWDLSFLMTPYDFLPTYAAMKGLTLFTRSVSHSKFIHNLFGLGSVVIPRFNLEDICSTLRITKQP